MERGWKGGGSVRRGRGRENAGFLRGSGMDQEWIRMGDWRLRWMRGERSDEYRVPTLVGRWSTAEYRWNKREGRKRGFMDTYLAR